ncbi:hypothetical protein QEN19_004016 [Hanseniaspora menglaensis]
METINKKAPEPVRKKAKIDRMTDAKGFRYTKNQAVNQEPDLVEYVLDEKYRAVKPYWFTYKTFCKARWRDRNIVDIFTNEFRARKPQDYINALEAGLVFVNGSEIDSSYILRNGDLLEHKTHTHEPKVSSKPIKIVFESDDLVVIDKPSSLTAHPVGRFRFNTVTKILDKELGIIAHPINRLDRLTSGLMFLCKNPKMAEKMRQSLFNREFSKEYIARVAGEFPLCLNNNVITVDKPIASFDARTTLNIVDEKNGKPSQTVFQRISYDPKSNTSIVKCKPLTGRTHQIRVHLQYLGFPIANDPIYSNAKAWGPGLGKNAKYDKELSETVKVLEGNGKVSTTQTWLSKGVEIEGEKFSGNYCDICKTELYTDPSQDELSLWLHAFKYESLKNEDPNENWSYSTDIPLWCTSLYDSYMKKALLEADKCEATDKAFNVGCLIVKDDAIVSSGFSRELEGNTHAEQNAITKLIVQKKCIPEGSVLYTTMEPCSERLSGNIPCVERIIEQSDRIETVVIGCLEPQTFIENNTSLKKLSENGINYIILPGFKEQAEKIAFKGHPEK